MKSEAIDWNQAWKESRARGTVRSGDPRFWDKKARYDERSPQEEGYARAFLGIMDPQPDWSVLDMACGSGALAIPLAKRVRAVTAVDFSSKMLDILDVRCKNEMLGNVRIIPGRWEDDWASLGIGEHDGVIASRSLLVDDLQEAIAKLNGIARKRVCISTIAGDGPHDRRIFEAAGRELDPGPGYIYYYNLLCQMDIRANLKIVSDIKRKSYSDLDDAVENVRLSMGEMSEMEEKKVRKYLKRHLLCRNGRWSLDYEHVVRWAVMWWDKEDWR